MNGWAPGLGFVLGSSFGEDANIYNKAVAHGFDENGWLTRDSIIADPYLRRKTETINYRVNAEPFQGFKIDITGQRNYAESYQHYYRFSDQLQDFEIFTPTNGGSFSSSYLMIATSFAAYDTTYSKLYNDLLTNRKVIAERIARNNSQWIEYVNEYVYDSLAGDYFPKGYTSSSPEVLMYSFISAYTGQDPNKVNLKPFSSLPLPNWSITYNGLTNIPAVAKIFKTISLTHSYKSNYAISTWTSNVNYDESNPIQTYENSDIIIPKYDIMQLVLNEQFMPLIGIDIGLQNSMTANFQYKKSRTMTLSFSNNQLTEVNGSEIVIGAGYRLKGLKFNIKPVFNSGTQPKGKTVNNDLVFKLDIGFRKDITVLRRIDENNNQVSAGQNKINIYFTADYNFSQRLSAQAFFKYDVADPFVANNFYNSTTYAGLTIRFSLAQ